MSDKEKLVPGYDDLPLWLSTGQVADIVGRSKSWVRLHLAKFDAREDENGYYRIPKRAVLHYLLNRTEEVTP